MQELINLNSVLLKQKKTIFHAQNFISRAYLNKNSGVGPQIPPTYGKRLTRPFRILLDAVSIAAASAAIHLIFEMFDSGYKS